MFDRNNGSAPDFAGKNIANPIGEMLSTVMLMDWLDNRYGDKKLFEVGQVVQTAKQELLIEGICTQNRAEAQLQMNLHNQ